MKKIMNSFVKDESLAIANLRGGSDPRFAVPHGPIPGYSHLPRGQEGHRGHRPAAAFIRFLLLKMIKLLCFEHWFVPLREVHIVCNSRVSVLPQVYERTANRQSPPQLSNRWICLDGHQYHHDIIQCSEVLKMHHAKHPRYEERKQETESRL
jgi:hypothetical protein